MEYEQYSSSNSTSEESDGSNASEAESTNEDDVPSRSQIRQNLSELSFEQLLKLKNKMGSKLYNKTVFGNGEETTQPRPKSDLKRANKNRPREISSKIKPRQLKRELVNIPKGKTFEPRDPRFDPICGEFDERSFKSNYKFIGEIQSKEKQKLMEELKECEDQERRKTLKLLIQRLDNKLKDRERKQNEARKRHEEKEELKEKLKKGEKPAFKKKSVKKLETLIEKYEDLKRSNKLQKHIERRSKKLAAKERKKNIVN